jgi:hypothetical protein
LIRWTPEVVYDAASGFGQRQGQRPFVVVDRQLVDQAAHRRAVLHRIQSTPAHQLTD